MIRANVPSRLIVRTHVSVIQTVQCNYRLFLVTGRLDADRMRRHKQGCMTRTILIADADPVSVRSLKTVLQSARLMNPLHVVKDGAETIAFLEGAGLFTDRSRYPYPALVFLDLRLPKISGVEVLEYLDFRPQHKHLAIVVFTPTGNLDQIRQAYQLGASSFLTKPASAQDFWNLMKWLKSIELIAIPGGYAIDYVGKLRPARCI